MTFMTFPPEFNSSLMYNGAGSGPLMAAASAWDELAADLEATAASYQTVLTQLTGTTWLGPSSARMACIFGEMANCEITVSSNISTISRCRAASGRALPAAIRL